jgi:hypothetical protein
MHVVAAHANHVCTVQYATCDERTDCQASASSGQQGQEE